MWRASKAAHDYLVKPFDASELNARVRTMLQLKDAARIQSELAGIRASLEVAREMQRSLLPSGTPHAPGLELALRYRAMETVGGDYYDYIIRDGQTGLFMADVCGHGVPAALVVSIVKIAFWFQRDHLDAPDALLRGVNAALSGSIGGSFVTAGYAAYNSETRELKIGNAGHPALLWHRRADGEIRSVRPKGRLLGIFAEPDFEVETIRLEPGDRILLYTDGVLEARNAEREMFGEERLLGESGDMGVQEFAERLLETLAIWAGGERLLDDDIAVIVGEQL